MALKDWIKIDRAFRYRVEWIKRNTDKRLVVKKTNFANNQNWWDVIFEDAGVSKMLNSKLRTKSQTLKFVKSYMSKY